MVGISVISDQLSVIRFEFSVEKANQSNFVALDELNQLRDNNYREFVDNLGLFPLIYKLQFDSYRDHRGPKRQFHRWRHKETRLHRLYN